MNKKLDIEPLTGTQIRQAVGVTKEQEEAVRRILERRADFPTLDQCYDDVDPGWRPILEALNSFFNYASENAESGLKPPVKIIQLKEKFGGLRCYPATLYSFTPEEADEIHAAIHMAEYMSFKMCEKCGSIDGVETRTANHNPYGWVKTYCAKHHVERDQARKGGKDGADVQ